MSVRVLLADDQVLIRSGFSALLNTAADIDVVGEASDGATAIRQTHALRPDVVLMDIRMPGTDGLEATRAITSTPELNRTRVVVLTTFEADEYVLAALRAGASGFLDKGVEPDDLIEAVRVVARGDSLLPPKATRSLIARFVAQPDGGAPARDPAALAVLTDRERETTAMVALGLSNVDIAARLRLSPLTVKTHVNRAMAKLEARDRAQLVVFAYQSGLVQPGDNSGTGSS